MPIMLYRNGSAPACKVTLRRFPYPYRAGLAICSDIDLCDRKTFINYHRFLNGTKNGLRLPVADSFFVVGKDPQQIAYFKQDGKTHSADAELIRQAIHDRLIDSLHSWGDFNRTGPDPVFIGNVSKRLIEEFHTYDLKINIWINHGDSFNYQNMYARLNSNYHGDDPSSSFYTANLLGELGIQFYWLSELLPWPLSADSLKGSPPVWLRKTSRRVINSMKNVIKRMVNRKSRIRPNSQLMELMYKWRRRDNAAIFGFTRFNHHPRGIWTLPTRHTMHHSLNNTILTKLIRQEAYLILYTHLGLPIGNSVMFPKNDRIALENLAQKYHDGVIWISPTRDLLSYWKTHRYMRWKAEQAGEMINIDLETIPDPITGRRFPEEKDLAGICFYSACPEKTAIRLRGKQLKLVINPSDYTGRPSLSFPLPQAPCTDVVGE